MQIIIDLPIVYVEQAMSGRYNYGDWCFMAIREALINGIVVPKSLGKIDEQKLKCMELDLKTRADN